MSCLSAWHSPSHVLCAPVESISDVDFSEQPHCCRVSDVRDEGYSLLG